jgi:catechol 2,3-dioxygenase-like lactoylglutathione lyase family enzyme
MISGVHHVALVVSDLDAMTAFYRDACGLTLVGEAERDGEFVSRVVGFEGAHLRLRFLRAEGDSTVLELIEYVQPKGRDQHGTQNGLGSSHFCFRVNDLEATYQRLSNAGMRFVAPPATEIQQSGRTHKACYVQDPEGNWVEFTEVSE